MLFSPSDIPENIPPAESTNFKKREKRPYQVLSFPSYTHFAKEFNSIDPSHDYHIINLGTWSMHEFLLYLVKNFAGPSAVWITTWSINESVIQSILMAKNEGLFTDVNFLFDYRVKKYRPAAWYLAEKNFNCKLTSCHAKVTVIEGEKMHLTIIGSANYTRNNRIEVMILMPGTDEANRHKSWISEKITATDG